MEDPAFAKSVRDLLVNLSDGDSYPLLTLTEDARFWLNRTNSCEPARSLVERVARHLLQEHLMVVGELLPPDGAFRPLAQSADAILTAILSSWELNEHLPREAMSHLWLLGTPEGAARGKSLIPELNADPDIDA